MTTDSNLNPAQNPGVTDNPQSVDGSVGATDANSFQQSAGIESLDSTRPLSVTQTGKPYTAVSPKASNSTLTWIFIIVCSVILVMVARAVFKWVIKRPATLVTSNKVATKPVSTTKPTPISKSATKVIVRQQGKKLSRSKRRKIAAKK